MNLKSVTIIILGLPGTGQLSKAVKKGTKSPNFTASSISVYPFICLCVSAAAVLVLLSAAARTRIVSSDLFTLDDRVHLLRFQIKLFASLF